MSGWTVEAETTPKTSPPLGDYWSIRFITLCEVDVSGGWCMYTDTSV